MPPWKPRPFGFLFSEARAALRGARWRRHSRAEVRAKATSWAISSARCAWRCQRSQCSCPANASFALNSCRNVWSQRNLSVPCVATPWHRSPAWGWEDGHAANGEHEDFLPWLLQTFQEALGELDMCPLKLGGHTTYVCLIRKQLVWSLAGKRNNNSAVRMSHSSTRGGQNCLFFESPLWPLQNRTRTEFS